MFPFLTLLPFKRQTSKFFVSQSEDQCEELILPNKDNRVLIFFFLLQKNTSFSHLCVCSYNASSFRNDFRMFWGIPGIEKVYFRCEWSCDVPSAKLVRILEERIDFGIKNRRLFGHCS